MVNDWVDRLFNKHKLVRRTMVFWAIYLVTFVLTIAMLNMDKITGPVATVIVSVVGLIATVLAFYQWSRTRD